MKKVFSLAFWAMCTLSPSYAMPGCMDSSSYLEDYPDFKNLRYVACSCPCVLTTTKRANLCLICRHYHEAFLLVPIKNSDLQLKKPLTYENTHYMGHDPLITLKRFVLARYPRCLSRACHTVACKKK